MDAYRAQHPQRRKSKLTHQIKVARQFNCMIPTELVVTNKKIQSLLFNNLKEIFQ